MSDLVTFELVDGVGHIQLNRPDAANSFNLPSSRAFGAVVNRAAETPEVRAVLVTGAGPRFCGGGDVSSFVAADDPSAYINELALDLDRALRRLAAIPKPVVAVVHGAVAGAGLGLMLSCDVIVAAQATKFVFAYPSVGLTPDCGVSYLLPRAIGQQRALSFALADQPVTADVALDWGMVTEVVDGAHARGWEVAATLAAGPAIALGQVRRLLRSSWDLDRERTGQEEARVISQAVAGAEAQRLIARFVNR